MSWIEGDRRRFSLVELAQWVDKFCEMDIWEKDAELVLEEDGMDWIDFEPV